jgi:hypothetical protein
MDTIHQRLFITDLIKMDFPQSVFEEVQYLLSQVCLDYDDTWLSLVFKDMVNLYNGSYPGYRQCTTPYHDLKHITDSLLALASLINGAHASGIALRERHVTLAMISILLHETGFIQQQEDTEGTGAKYTIVRTERSIEFLDNYFSSNGYDDRDLRICRDFIRCTGMDGNIAEISFETRGEELLGKMVATADIIGQIADRTYLEKLLFLFQELSEVHILGVPTELDLLENTIETYKRAQYRMEHELDNVKSYLLPHFRSRWDIGYDMYMDAVESNISYLTYLLENHRSDYRDKLQRGGLLKRLAILEESDKG